MGLGKVWAYFWAKDEMLDRSVMSKTKLEAFWGPWPDTKSSSRSLRRPTAVTWIFSATSLFERPSPMPEVAPMTSACLYGKFILIALSKNLFASITKMQQSKRARRHCEDKNECDVILRNFTAEHSFYISFSIHI
jgi:hypothetical protein